MFRYYVFTFDINGKGNSLLRHFPTTPFTKFPTYIIAKLRIISIIASNDQLSNKMLFQVKMKTLTSMAYTQHLKMCHINGTKYIMRSSDNLQNKINFALNMHLHSNLVILTVHEDERTHSPEYRVNYTRIRN